MRVLIAEDDADVRLLLQRAVASLGHQFLVAASGDVALELFRTHQPDVVVSDWRMPGLDGIELCRYVREQADAPYTYFILLTALSDKQHMLQGVRAGADDYLVKPFSYDSLRARLTTAERITSLHRQACHAVARREELLRVVSRVATEINPSRLVQDVLAEAVDLLGASVGVVYRWSESPGKLEPVWDASRAERSVPFHLGQAASLRAVERRAPVRLDALHHAGETPPDASGVNLVLAVPLLHRGQLLGALAVGSDGHTTGFDAGDVELLELLASSAAAELAGLERARLSGALIAASTMAHHLNNQLALTVGYGELLANDPRLPAELRRHAIEAMNGAQAASETLAKLQRITRLEHAPGPLGDAEAHPLLDLERSSRPVL